MKKITIVQTWYTGTKFALRFWYKTNYNIEKTKIKYYAGPAKRADQFSIDNKYTYRWNSSSEVGLREFAEEQFTKYYPETTEDPRVKCPKCNLYPLQSTIDRWKMCGRCYTNDTPSKPLDDKSFKFVPIDMDYAKTIIKRWEHAIKEETQSISPKCILITGGCGFIGYNLALSLKLDGHTVYCVDNFNDYYDVELKRHRSRNLVKAGVHVIKSDVMDISDVLSGMIFDNTRPDVVMHLAAMAGVRHSIENPYMYIDGNINVTQKLIDACEQHDIKKVVYASTSCVMAGNPLPWTEDLPTGHQLNPYGWSKRVNECQFKSSKIENSIGLRFFTVYGPWGRPDMALFTFADQIVKGEPITVFNDGNMIRDFTYIDDIVDGIKIVLTVQHPNNEIYNIGRGEQVQLMDFVGYIEKYLGRTATVIKAPKHPADTQATWSCADKLKKHGYNPQVSIEEGVKRFIDWYKVYYGVQ